MPKPTLRSGSATGDGGVGRPMVMNNVETKEGFGCTTCWPESAVEACRAQTQLQRIAYLIDESHFIVSLLHCAECSQKFLTVFTELVDWMDGEDPQYRTMIPLKEDEVDLLLSAKPPLSESTLNAMAPDRRSLRSDFPKGFEKPRAYWSSGMSVGPHD